MKEDVLLKFTQEFIESFEVVFGEIDWEHTKFCLSGNYDDFLIKQGGTFLEPKVEDEGNKWVCRANLLKNYRLLKFYLKIYDRI
ncbi:MAG: hypothetical protein SFT90_03865 [Rickettsiales bacterium]|nr:hypothetical protein [Rickettsiales bacterium]